MSYRTKREIHFVGGYTYCRHIAIQRGVRSSGKDVIPMAPHEASRYNERSAVERFNSRLKEEFGGCNVMVRGAEKVKTHLMFGVIAIFADQLLKLVS